MQLGELQHQLSRFDTRETTVLALSVDLPEESEAMIKRMGLQFPLGSDRHQDVISAFKVQNPSTQELALHAVYIVDQAGKIFYRKVARKRPSANELIDAIDAHLGVYPQEDRAIERRPVNVAYPTNNFQALLEVARANTLPQAVDGDAFEKVRKLAETIHSDDALIAYREFINASVHASREDLLQVAAWLARITYFEPEAEALDTGHQLAERLLLVATLEEKYARLEDPAERDATSEKLREARALLTRTRAIVTENADAWRLRLLKTSIRSYREVALAVLRSRKAN